MSYRDLVSFLILFLSLLLLLYSWWWMCVVGFRRGTPSCGRSSYWRNAFKHRLRISRHRVGFGSGEKKRSQTTMRPLPAAGGRQKSHPTVVFCTCTSPTTCISVTLGFFLFCSRRYHHSLIISSFCFSHSSSLSSSLSSSSHSRTRAFSYSSGISIIICSSDSYFNIVSSLYVAFHSLVSLLSVYQMTHQR